MRQLSLEQLQAFWEEILKLWRDPFSNVTASLLVLGIVALVVLFIVLLVIMIIVVPSRRADDADLEELKLLSLVAGQDIEEYAPAGKGSEKTALSESSAHAPEVAVGLPVKIAASLAVVLLVIVAVGASSSNNAVCAGCHTSTLHLAAIDAGNTDPHSRTSCVACHEAPGLAGRLTVEVPGRLSHIVTGLAPEPREGGYGWVVDAACLRCHPSILRGVTEDTERGVRMVHSHPLNAGASCLECHGTRTGIINNQTRGMSPCLRCHDGKEASADCSSCHTKDVGAAARPDLRAAKMEGRVLIETPDCGGCHTMNRECDPCHGGVPMPHSELFRWYGHAREGVKDIWDTNGQKCGRCHTAQRRPCTRCHAFFPGHPSPQFKTTHTKASPGACVGCHNPKAYVNGRDFCGLCHTKPYITR